MKLNKIKAPHKIYAEVIEDSALDQFISAMDQPYVEYGALMPDTHTGYSLPIGSVVATKDVIVPAWVGYDIGCGMCALQLEGITKDDIEANSEAIFEGIYKAIPVGFNINDEETGMNWIEDLEYLLSDEAKEILAKKNYKRAIGSLGGGNHFIEVGYDEDETAWVVIHSGSRGVGHGIATHYMKLAHPEGKAKDGHHGFATDSVEGKAYINDMEWALNFAIANRFEMMNRIVNVITESLDLFCYEIDFGTIINRNHNHAVLTDGLWVHRKGATHAEKDMLGVIPGNMRDGSFIVKGKGNPDSLYSSSHGAGRVLGRRKAKETLDLEVFKKEMVGVTAKVDDKTLDESPMAYKDIFEVMRLQEDLVEVLHHVKPLVNIKG